MVSFMNIVYHKKFIVMNFIAGFKTKKPGAPGFFVVVVFSISWLAVLRLSGQLSCCRPNQALSFLI